MKKAVSKIPTIIGILILILGVGVGVFLVQRTQILRLGASPEAAPKDVRITNVTSSSFTVSWITDQATIGYLTWGENDSNLENTKQEETTEPKDIHSITLGGLSPQTIYYFKINSDGDLFDNNKIPWQQATGPILAPTTITQMLSGTVLTATGQPAIGAVVHVSSGSFASLSTVTSDTGGWLIPLSSARSADLANHATININSTLIDIFVQGGSAGVSSAQAYPVNSNPTPNMVLGQTHNFKNIESGNGGSTSSTITLPEKETSSGFSVDEQNLDTTSEEVTIESIEEDETIATASPEFFGEGPIGTKITITIRSDPQIDEVTVDSAGNWKWTPPSDLEEGEHSITISWRDAAGILHTITRNFVVSAASGTPSFESTPSASPTATPKTTLKATASPTATPRVSLPATGEGTPVAGSLTPTFLLATMGLGLILAGVFVSVDPSE